ncbi:MAG: efflux RND transporter periplasmic adaptor subunit [Verrucomicrobiales bacterium]
MAALVFTSCKKESASSAGAETGAAGGRVQVVETAPVERRDMTELLQLVGSLEANESASVRPEISGVVSGIDFKEGQPVKKDEPLVTIDNSELAAQRAETESRHRLAVANRDRNAILIKSNSISKAELDATEAEVTRLMASLNLIDVRLDKMAIKAPFDGVVGARSVSPGELVSPETVITTVEDLSRLKVDFAVPEKFYRGVDVGSPFRLLATGHVDEKGELIPLPGEVYFVSATINRNTRAAQVRGFVDKPPPRIKPGMFVTVELVLVERKRVLSVPEGALLASARGSTVIAVREKSGKMVAEFVPVQTGLRQLGYVEIKPAGDALTEGMPVVAAGVGVLVLFPGAAVKPVPMKTDIEKQGSRL